MSNFTLLRALAGASTVGLTSAAAFGQTVAANDAESVVVTDRKLNVDLLPEKILDTPQSIDVVPAQVIKEQGVTSLQDALKNVPGITLNAGEGGTHRAATVVGDYVAGMTDRYAMDEHRRLTDIAVNG